LRFALFQQLTSPKQIFDPCGILCLCIFCPLRCRPNGQRIRSEGFALPVVRGPKGSKPKGATPQHSHRNLSMQPKVLYPDSTPACKSQDVCGKYNERVVVSIFWFKFAPPHGSPAPLPAGQVAGEEFELVSQALYTDSKDQSGWIYAHWLAPGPPPPPGTPWLMAQRRWCLQNGKKKRAYQKYRTYPPRRLADGCDGAPLRSHP